MDSVVRANGAYGGVVGAAIRRGTRAIALRAVANASSSPWVASAEYSDISVVPNVRPMRASVVRAWYTAMSEVTSPWMTAIGVGHCGGRDDMKCLRHGGSPSV